MTLRGGLAVIFWLVTVEFDEGEREGRIGCPLLYWTRPLEKALFGPSDPNSLRVSRVGPERSELQRYVRLFRR
jgi:hypothetical protein